MTTHNLSKRNLFISIAVLALVAVACVCTDLTSLVPSSGGGGGGGSAPNTFDGGDGLDTIGGGTVTVGGGPVTGELNGLFEAENWTFQGTSGQTVTIEVNAIGETDPRFKLLDPSGNVVVEDDDSGGGYNATATVTLTVSGTYTIRVDVFTEGQYTVSVK